ncbi:helix-turn-helix domain-containing protein [Limimaricola pyoseonensis]|uniref:Transcriptional regulator, contains XRE-family HTH domain n=1 Tax=Limimaricola pyoseonensis TaxID=521013 RepID=A0A1G7E5Q3_9RHOB|nr:XRE family transcriptional regulator [Limimaricola pyoseonensis]SDE59058.1 Transcriptional regulator, contains XRE-family HTH domain [Limimaricola pyoseonensis]
MHDQSPDGGSLGADLRRHRQARGMRIADLAALIGRSTGWISQVERGRSHPGYADLVAIARALDMPLAQLFRNGTTMDERQDVLRPEQRRILYADNTGATDDLLAPVVGGIEVYRSVLMPNSVSDRPTDWHRLEIGYVISGAAEIRIGGRAHSVAAGDSFVNRGESQSWLNPHDTPCVLIWVLAPLPDDPAD